MNLNLLIKIQAGQKWSSKVGNLSSTSLEEIDCQDCKDRKQELVFINKSLISKGRMIRNQ